MCGRYTLRDPRGHPWLADAPQDLAGARYNVAPSQPVLALGRDREGVRRVRAATWGFHPEWLPENRRAPINARAETAATTPMFRRAFARGRCLIPADGWYEWQARDKGPKVPWFFHRPDDGVFFFAGLATLDRDHRTRVAILTTDANDTARGVHPRMPLMLPNDEAAGTWLDPEADPDTLSGLLLPPPSDLIAAYPVSRRVNKPENDDRRCLDEQPIEPAPDPGVERGQ